ncbi:MAG: hypothetical protein NTZ25_05090 [Candidatus Peregrinibacteria bacterium]|nr:hypothetical protein [Candidatus Peregrinibacteria bacterium]
MAKEPTKTKKEPGEIDELELKSPLPPESAPQAVDASAAPIADIISTTTAEATKEELDLKAVRDSVENYSGEGFSERAQEKAELTEYLQRLGKDKGRYFGNIVHQGVRDHFGKDDHMSGLGQYAAEINALINDDAIKSRLCRQKNDPEYIATVKLAVQKLMEEKNLSEEEAFQYFAETQLSLNEDGHQGITDGLAVHFSSNSILNVFYGAETDNEAFLIVPENIALTGRQYWSRAVDTAYSRDTMYNDVYIWPEHGEENGISLNGSLIFVPRDNEIDEQNGSQYEIENGKVVVDIDKIEKFYKAISKLDKSDYQNYRKEVIKVGKALGFDEKKVDELSTQYYGSPEVAEEKEKLESIFEGEELEEIKKYIKAVLLVDSKYSDIGIALTYFSELEELKESYRPLQKERLIRAGFNTDILDEIFADPVKKSAIQKFVDKYAENYSYLAKNSHGFFYKSATKSVAAKKYYEKLILAEFKDVKIREIKSATQDIVEYRGHDQNGKEKVLRVVYYTNTDPNRAVRKFYQDLGIQFDDRVIDDTSDEADKATRDTKRTTFEDVKYRYDYKQLRTNVLNQF